MTDTRAKNVSKPTFAVVSTGMFLFDTRFAMLPGSRRLLIDARRWSAAAARSSFMLGAATAAIIAVLVGRQRGSAPALAMSDGLLFAIAGFRW